ncbi:nitrate reductase [bacterium]|nr:MAG: nitrate reductase [bacterium]
MLNIRTVSFIAVAVCSIALGVVAGYAASDVLFAGSKIYTEEELGIRKEPLYDESDTVPTHGETTKKEPGESTKFLRSFENSPPLIPHDITDMLPLAESDNICLGCHMPDEAKPMGATPLPKSHFVDLDTGKDLGENLDGNRYNCLQCHVVQNIVTAPVVNVFKGDFRSEGGEYRSNLIDTLNEGVDIE